MTLLTEDEARQKWCPFARAAKSWSDRAAQFPDAPPVQEEVVAAAVNRGKSMEDKCNCIASACMAWRTAKTEAPGRYHWKDTGRPVDAGTFMDPDAVEWRELVPVQRGHCGAFGRPGR